MFRKFFQSFRFHQQAFTLTTPAIDVSVINDPAPPVADKTHLRALILDTIRNEGPFTCDELEQRLGLKHQTASARMSELKSLGLIRPAGKRPTSSGRNANVYEAVDIAVTMEVVVEPESAAEPAQTVSKPGNWPAIPELVTGTVLYRMGNSNPYTICGFRTKLQSISPDRYSLREQIELRYDGQYSHTASIFINRQALEGSVFRDDGTDYLPVRPHTDHEGGIWFLTDGLWTFDRADWERSEQKRKTELPVRALALKVQPGISGTPADDLRKQQEALENLRQTILNEYVAARELKTITESA